MLPADGPTGGLFEDGRPVGIAGLTWSWASNAAAGATHDHAGRVRGETTGRVYVACVMDAYSRRIIGWQTGDHLRTDLSSEALEMSFDHRRHVQVRSHTVRVA